MAKTVRLFPSLLAGVALVASAPVPAVAQDPLGLGTRGEAAKPLVPLKVDLVLSRTAGDKKISSMPYHLWLTANAPERETRLRMGVQVPVPTTMVGTSKEGERVETPSYTYRDVGTNIDCSVVTSADGRFGVTITLNDSGIHFDPKDTTRSVLRAASFRNFTSRFFLLLKDGQTATYISATDPVTGETLKVDVTLSVLK